MATMQQRIERYRSLAAICQAHAATNKASQLEHEAAKREFMAGLDYADYSYYTGLARAYEMVVSDLEAELAAA